MKMLRFLTGGSGTPPKRLMRPATMIPLFSFVLLGLIVLYYFSPFNLLHNAHAASLTVLPGQQPAIVKQSQVVSGVDPNTPVTLAVSLRLRNESGLTQYVKSVSQAKQREKRFLTPDQVIRAYAPLPSSEQAVTAYMQQYGLQVTSTSSYHTVIGFSGTIGQAENAMHVQVSNYRAANGKTFYAPSSNVNVPASIAPFIQSVTGLDNVVHYTHPPIMHKQISQKSKSAVTANSGQVCAPSPSQISSGQYYTPSQLKSAYNLNGLYSQGFQGQGQTIGLVEYSYYKSSDVGPYVNCYGGGSVPVAHELVGKGSGTAVGADEVSLDVDILVSTAPKLAGVRIYDTPNSDAGTLLLLDRIVTDALPVVSTSWGVCESYVIPSTVQAEGNQYLLAAAQGQTIVASSGDYGSSDCYNQDPNNPNNIALAVDDPASNPYVTGVGGTSLNIDNNNYSYEATWNYGIDGAGGGGISSFWTMPSWQQGPGVIGPYSSAMPCNASSGYCREVPDVSLNANPYYGYLMYCTADVCNSEYGGGWWVFGGTSAATPMWAAMIALTNQKSLYQGGFTMGYLNPMLYQIGQNASEYSNDFHDITSGNNSITGSAQYTTTTGYDMATGLGSYNAANLANDLITINNAATGTVQPPANKTWYFAEGSVGGSFSEFITVLNPNPTPATVTVNYLFEGGSPKQVQHTVAANSRATLSANTDLNVSKSARQVSISAIVSSDIPVVAERPMYFDIFGVPGGTDVLGATQPQTSFYFAEGDARKNSTQSYATFVTMLNPSTTQTANVTVNYYANGTKQGTKTLTIGPMQRGTTSPADIGINKQVAFTVTSDIGIVAERPMYFHDNIANAGGALTGAASAVGATAPGNDWLFAEGHTGNNFQEYIVLANFTASATTANVKLEYSNGTSHTYPVTVNAYSQYYFNVNNVSTGDVSAEVTDTTPAIVAERLEYFHFGGQHLPGGTDVVGLPGTATQTKYSFSEGSTAQNFYEYITLQNPGSTTAQVAVTLYADKTIMQQSYELAPHSRKTVDINAIEDPLANAYPGSGANDVSIEVQTVSGTVVAERPMYFKFANLSTGGTDVIGYIGNEQPYRSRHYIEDGVWDPGPIHHLLCSAA